MKKHHRPAPWARQTGNSYHSVPSTSNMIPLSFGALCSFFAPGFRGANRRGVVCVDMLAAGLSVLILVCATMTGARMVGISILKRGGTRAWCWYKWGGMDFEQRAARS